MNEEKKCCLFDDLMREDFLKKLLNGKKLKHIRYLDCTLRVCLDDKSLLSDFSLLLEYVSKQMNVSSEKVYRALAFCTYDACCHKDKNELQEYIFGGCNFASVESFFESIMFYIESNYSVMSDQKKLQLHR